MEYVAISSPGDLPNAGTEHRSLALQEESLLSELPGQPHLIQKCQGNGCL